MKGRIGIDLLLLAIVLLNCTNRDDRSIAGQSTKPNIIFIFADDQRYETIHALGNAEIITPNLDKLVSKGTTFTHAYNMGAWNGAVCVASRAMLISGRSVWRALKTDSLYRKGGGMEQTWGKLMEQGGYDTYMTGKWHVEAPAPKVFRTTAHIRPGMPGDAWHERKSNDGETIMPVGYNRPRSENDHTWSPTDTTFGGFWEGGKHWSEVLKDDAIAFLDSAHVSENPFFMYLAFNAPHDPRQAPQEYQDMYPLENISVPENWLPVYPYQNQIGLGPTLRDEALAPFPRTAYATKVHIKEYYASISHLDAQIGLILEALEKSGKGENTYIIFTADHGLAVGKHGLMGKQNMYDHSIRAPFIIAGPGIPMNKKIDTDIYLQDAMATALALGSVEKPSFVEFNSVLDLATGQTTAGSYPAIYGAYMNLQRMVRKDNWKLMVYPGASKVRLYDLSADPWEKNDLSDDPKFQAKIKSLFDALLKLQEQLGDTLDLTEIYQKTIK
ncbi:MAG: sulfatase-like hydrolase/transferase [Cyclobacteriaceae bacterium]|nr:sulfatase-like hydrolase/transferase [Cyclobacteriaceae bacterium]MDH4298752.1 sulfatase-like hydrolase/transferase [Cyclobacteriaceae bacterium]MDH5249514.1 sulfatase-like hydrolase/transferase [Cyclobacteriaceae bacterium]